ncbi:MAG: cytochrome c oxidase subunit II [Rickettsiales bacterium]|nr:cytochrome c oxidase subunit II [Rickettsiales bacterium]
MIAFVLSCVFILCVTVSSVVFAAEQHIGMAKPWQVNFQEPVTPVMEQLYAGHNALLYIITAITCLVLGVMIYIALRFNRRANPVPSKTTHNTLLEVIWTAIPILILVLIAVPSLRLHYFIEDYKDADMTLKVVGHQWYWSYEYPDHGGFGFDSNIKADADLEPGEPRLLAVDNPVVVPVNTKVRVLLTGADVIHAWAVPAFGVKRDTVPGRLNESWFKAQKIGVYYGQCSELCGVKHGFMPIEIHVVSQEDFDAWIKEKQKQAGIQPVGAKATAASSEANQQ